MADVDWTRWLPPHPLPDTGKKQFKPGQVWSGRAPGSDDRAAVVGWDDAGHPALLAGGGDGTLTHNYSERGERWSRHAVLVQDAGQSEPTPPDVLYGGYRGSELLPGDVVETTFGRFKLVEFLGQWSPSSGPMMNWRADPVDDLWKAVAGEGREPPTNIAFTSREMLGVIRGWRAGQRRRVLATNLHPAFEGVVTEPPSGYATEGPAGVWVIATPGGAKMWALESEPSELLEEGPPQAPAREEQRHMVIAPCNPDPIMAEYAKVLDEATRKVANSMQIPAKYLLPPMLPPPPWPESPPRCEVSSNGRDWVDHASLVDPDPFEAYEHQRIGGVEQRPAKCGESRCQSAGTWRDRRIGGLHKRVFQCDNHFLRSEDIVRSGMDDHENLSRSNAARMRMAEMDHNAAGLGGSALAPGAYPKTFGGIWRTR